MVSFFFSKFLFIKSFSSRFALAFLFFSRLNFRYWDLDGRRSGCARVFRSALADFKRVVKFFYHRLVAPTNFLLGYKIFNWFSCFRRGESKSGFGVSNNSAFDFLSSACLMDSFFFSLSAKSNNQKSKPGNKRPGQSKMRLESKESRNAEPSTPAAIEATPPQPPVPEKSSASSTVVTNDQTEKAEVGNPFEQPFLFKLNFCSVVFSFNQALNLNPTE